MVSSLYFLAISQFLTVCVIVYLYCIYILLNNLMICAYVIGSNLLVLEAILVIYFKHRFCALSINRYVLKFGEELTIGNSLFSFICLPGKYTIITFEEFISIALDAKRVVGIYPEIKNPVFINQHV